MSSATNEQSVLGGAAPAIASSASPVTDDPRLGDVVRCVGLEQLSGAMKSDPRTGVVLAGFPYDEGCRRNGGRVGAESGPAVARRLIQRMGTVVNPELDLDLRTIGLFDVGDVEPGSTLESAHVSLESRVHAILSAHPHAIPFVIGGSNDQSYPNAAALMRHMGSGDIGVVNIDAHLDVRPLKNGLVHSGSPFRQLLEDPRFKQHLVPVDTADGGRVHRFVEFAAQGSQCSKEHVDYLLEAGRGRTDIIWLSSLAHQGQYQQSGGDASSRPTACARFCHLLDSLAGESLFISFDLDAVGGADAPGVSCPGTVGLTAADALDICFAAGRNPRVKLFDLSEFNPKVDEYRSGRLVANMFYYFCLGVAQRVKSAAAAAV